MSQSTYKVGQLVDFCGQRHIVRKVVEHHYFYGSHSPYWEYIVENVQTGQEHTAFEGALSLIREPVAKTKQTDCECGAHAVYWAVNQHAQYCPMFSKNWSKYETDFE